LVDFRKPYRCNKQRNFNFNFHLFSFKIFALAVSWKSAIFVSFIDSEHCRIFVNTDNRSLWFEVFFFHSGSWIRNFKENLIWSLIRRSLAVKFFFFLFIDLSTSLKNLISKDWASYNSGQFWEFSFWQNQYMRIILDQSLGKINVQYHRKWV